MTEWFGNGTGLMGSVENVDMVGRDGLTVFTDPSAMGQDWQVFWIGKRSVFSTNRDQS